MNHPSAQKKSERSEPSENAQLSQSGLRDVSNKPNEEQFTLLINTVKDYAIFLLDPQGYIRSWNPGAERIKGYKQEEIVGKHFSQFYIKEDIDNQKPAYELKVASQEGRYEEEGWRVKKDRSLFWASVTITALRDSTGTLRGFAKITRDMSSKKHAEEALRQSQEQYRLILESIKDYAILGLDAQGRIKSWNRGAERLKGYSSEEVIGTSFSIFYLPEEKDSGRPQFELNQAVKNGRFENEGWKLRKDGSRFWANVIITPIRNESGELKGFSNITRDITERKSFEEEIMKTSAALTAANKELEAFSYAVSHDLRVPLRGIDGFSQALLEDYDDQLDEQGKQYLHYVREGTQKMGHLIDDLLNLSRMTRLEMRVTEVDLSQLARTVIANLVRESPTRKVSVSIQENVKAVGDPGLLNVVMENLLSNAWKFTSQTPDASIEFGTMEQNSKVVYFVRDNGVGFNMKYYEKLFGAFQRLHADEEFKGTGVGLATVRRIITRHGGEIWAESKIKEGATFYFTL